MISIPGVYVAKVGKDSSSVCKFYGVSLKFAEDGALIKRLSFPFLLALSLCRFFLGSWLVKARLVERGNVSR